MTVRPLSDGFSVLKICWWLTAITTLWFGHAANGNDQFHLPTRAQTPLLQGYFIPANPRINRQGLSLSHSLYITNTYQTDNNSRESLVIDVENTRYDLQINIPAGLWHLNINVPLIANRPGFLDSTIENWHDLFGLPQGGRDSAVNDRIDLRYQIDGNERFNIETPSEGIGDIQVAAGYPLDHHQWLWFSLELPAGNNSELISNQSIDAASWYQTTYQSNDRIHHSALIGLSLLADDGLFKGQMNPHVVFAQYAFNWRFSRQIELLLQADYHSPIVENSNLDGLSHSLQAQFGLRFPALFEQHTLELFFSEDIWPGHAPDISFGLNLTRYQF